MASAERGPGCDCDSVPLIPPKLSSQSALHACSSIVYVCECTMQHHCLCNSAACSMAVQGSVARSAWLSVQADTSIAQHSAGFRLRFGHSHHTFAHGTNRAAACVRAQVQLLLCCPSSTACVARPARCHTSVNLTVACLTSHKQVAHAVDRHTSLTLPMRTHTLDTLHSHFRYARTHALTPCARHATRCM